MKKKERTLPGLVPDFGGVEVELLPGKTYEQRIQALESQLAEMQGGMANMFQSTIRFANETREKLEWLKKAVEVREGKLDRANDIIGARQ